MENEHYILSGIVPLREDDRDLHLGDILDLSKLEDVPDFYLDGGYGNAHIQEEDDCSAYAVTLARELRENIELDREFQFASMKDMTGDPERFGGDLRDAMATPVKIGALPRALRPSACEGKPLSYLRYIANWGDIMQLLVLAAQHRAKSYAFIKPTQGMDAFDTMLSTQYYWLQKGEKRAMPFGTYFDVPLSQYIIDKGWENETSGHAMAYRGKLTLDGVPYAIVQQNYGTSVGKNGLHLFGRERVNQSQKVFGIGYFTSYTPDELRWMIENGQKIDHEVITSTINAILSFCKDLIIKFSNHVRGIKG